MYSPAPGTGNLVFSLAVAGGSDPYGNFYPAGFVAGTDTQVQVVIAESGGTGLIEWFFQNVGFSNATFIGAVISTFAQLKLTGPANLTLGHTDWVGYQLNSSDGSSSANASLVYNDHSGGFHQSASWDADGFHIAAGKITAVQPGTGTVATPAVGESWHSATLINSWTGSGGGVNGLWYRLISEGPTGSVEIQADIINATATGNSICFTLPSGYIPVTAQNFPAGWNHPQASNSATVPWIFVDTSGNIQVTGIQVANVGIFFKFILALETL